MLDRISHILGLGKSRLTKAPNDLPAVDRADIRSFIVHDHGLPHVDWGAVDVWIERTVADGSRHEPTRRAVAAAWLDELRDSLEPDHRRWRTSVIEGLAPLEDNVSVGIAQAAERSISVIHKSLSTFWGGQAIAPVGMVALATKDRYYSFISHHYSEEGEWATSAGVYIRDRFPMLVLHTQARHGCTATIAHELTHHALSVLDLPLWVEEGLTQMMEERVTRQTDFVLTGRSESGTASCGARSD